MLAFSKKTLTTKPASHCFALGSRHNQNFYLSFCERQIQGPDRISVRELPKHTFSDSTKVGISGDYSVWINSQDFPAAWAA